jgi:TonB family protein
MKKNKYILLVLLVSIKSTILFGQTHSLKQCECKTDTIKVFGDPEKMPTFPGGESKLFEFIKKNAKYPKEAYEQKLEDKVILVFCVLETGEISNITVVRGKYEILNNEAIRVVKLMPKFEPAFGNGKNIPSKFVVPIIFKLNSTKVHQEDFNAPNR